MRIATIRTTKMAIVHFMIAGRTYCGMPGVPTEWPRDHVWVSRGHEGEVTCAECLSALLTLAELRLASLKERQ